MHVSGSDSVLPNEIKLLTSYVTPARGGADCTGIWVWGEIYAEFYIYKNGIYVSGGRTSAASPTLQLDCVSSPISLSGGDVLIVMAEHGGDTSRVLKASLLINLL